MSAPWRLRDCDYGYAKTCIMPYFLGGPCQWEAGSPGWVSPTTSCGLPLRGDSSRPSRPGSKTVAKQTRHWYTCWDGKHRG